MHICSKGRQCFLNDNAISFFVHIMYLIIRINALLHQSQINEMNVMLQHIHDFNAHNQMLTSSRFTITLWCFSLSVTYLPPGDFDRIVLFVFISILQKVFRQELKRDDNTIHWLHTTTNIILFELQCLDYVIQK